MKILVTGGAGFIGSNLCRRLIEDGHDVLALDILNLYYSPRRKLGHIKELLSHERFTFLPVDITKKAHLEQIFNNHAIEAVIHLAARAGVRNSVDKPLWYKETNVSGTLNLLELASQHQVKNFLCASSSSIYGHSPDYPFAEDVRVDHPISPYAASKISTELFCYTYSHLTNLPVTMMRFFTVYGPHNRPDMMMFRYIDGIENNKPIMRNGDGSMRRSFTYIDDIVDGMLKALHKPQPYTILNFGNENTISIKEAIDYLEEICGKKAIIKEMPHPKADPAVLAADGRKVLAELGWQPKIEFPEGAKKTLDWYRHKHADQLKKIYLPGVTKKIAVFSVAYIPFVGDAEMAVKHISDEIDHYFFDVITARLDRSLPRKEIIGNATVHRVGLGFGFDKYYYPLLAFFKAVSLNKRRPYDIAWGIMANYGGLAALLFSSLKRKVKYVLTLQSGDSDAFVWSRTWFWYPIYKMIYTKAHIIQAVSQHLADRARRYGYRGNIRLVPNGIIMPGFRSKVSEGEIEKFRLQLGFKKDDYILVSVSRLTKNSAIDDIINAMTYLPDDYKLLIVGRGKKESKLKLLVSKLNLETRVKFAGFVPMKELPWYLKVADVFVRPSIHEGLGNTFLEAMLYNVPVIGTKAGGLKELLIDRHTGFVCQVHDPEDLSKKVKYVRVNAQEVEQVINNAYKLASREYDKQTAAEGMKELFENIE